MAVPYEPYASFVWLFLWKHSAKDWLKLYALDNGVTLCVWADAQAKAALASMNVQDREAIDKHRQRSLGRNPIDHQADRPVPEIEDLLTELPK